MAYSVCFVMSVCTWCTTVLPIGTEQRAFIYCFIFLMFSSRVSVLGFGMFAFNGMRHSIVTGHHQPIITAASDILILAVRSSYMFNSFLYQIYMQSELLSLLSLSSVVCTRTGTMWIVLTGFRTLFSNFVALLNCAIFPLGIWKVLI